MYTLLILSREESHYFHFLTTFLLKNFNKSNKSMMQKIANFTLLVAILVGAITANAQTALVRQQLTLPKQNASQMKPRLIQPANLTGLEDVQSTGTPQQSVPTATVAFRNVDQLGEVAGYTNYDLQSNGTTRSTRMHVWPNGDVSMGWTGSRQPEGDGNGFSDRGTFVNYRSNWNAATPTYPNTRVENERTGFGNYLVTEDGTEFIVSHAGSATPKYRLHTSRRAAGATTWIDADIPSNVPKGSLWSHAAVDGNTIYVLALTAVTGAIGGTVYRGLDGHPLLWRSSDAGATWDIIDGVIPGLDSSEYRGLSSDTYSIDARDGVVAVGIFDTWGDTKIFKSSDKGVNWTSTTLIDIPMEKYLFNTGYTVDDLGGADPNAPNNDSLAVFTTDNGGTVHIDVLGNVNAWFGRMYVQDEDLADAGWVYYPGQNGLIYWGENDPESLYLSAFSQDWNNNDTLDIDLPSGAASALTGYGLASMPAAASDEDGNIYVAYSANVENLYDLETSENYRHTYLTGTRDFGQNWANPIDLQYAAFTPGSDTVTGDFTDAVFPQTYKLVGQDGKLHMSFQIDSDPGLAILVTGNQTEESSLVYVGFENISTLVFTNEIKPNTLDFTVSPNPAQGQTLVTVNLEKTADTFIELLDLNGRVVSRLEQGNMSAGKHALVLSTAALNNGLYILRMRSGNVMGVKKLMVANR